MPMRQIALRECREEDRDEAHSRRGASPGNPRAPAGSAHKHASAAPLRAAWVYGERRNRNALPYGEDLCGGHGITSRCRGTITSGASLPRLPAPEREVVIRTSSDDFFDTCHRVRTRELLETNAGITLRHVSRRPSSMGAVLARVARGLWHR